MRRHPHLYEINTWPWLADLSRRYSRRITLGTVPDEIWDGLRGHGIDLVYLMGIWRRSAIGRGIARSDPGAWASYDGAAPGWRIPEVVGSAFCISGYEPDPALGSMAELDRVREALHRRGMKLIVDFIPNHFGFDHPWTKSHPERFVQGSEEAFRASPTSFRLVELAGNEPRYVARARDPYFLPWSDVAQIDYSKADTREAMVNELRCIAQHADGARCDMAMLVLSDVFAGTWRMFVDPASAEGSAGRPGTEVREFWADARAAVPGFLLIAEVYWDMEWRLQELGFDFTYDKRLYDRLLHDGAASVDGHLHADPRYQDKSARFIENHDEPRSVVAFAGRVKACACAISTVPGLRFYYDGQLEGRRVRLPMQLGVDVAEPLNEALAVFYDRLLAIVDEPVFHEGEWSLCAVHPIEGSPEGLLAWRWRLGTEARLVVINPGHACARGLVEWAGELPGRGDVAVDELLGGHRLMWAREEIEQGVPVTLGAGEAAIFAMTGTPTRTA